VGNGVTTVNIDATAGGAVKLADPERALAAITGLNEPQTLRQARRLAWERFRELPMPTRKSEEWRYTDISSLRLEDFEPAIPGLNGDGPDGSELAGLDDLEAVPEPVREVLARSHERSGVWVQVDGVTVYHRLDDDLAERGVIFASIGTVARERPDLVEKYVFTSPIPEMEEKLWAAHVALLSEGFVLHVPPGVRLPAPIHTFRCITKPGTLVSTHSVVAVEEGGEATCIDEFMSPDLPETSINLAGAELFGGPEATLHYIALQRFGTGVKHFGLQHVTCERDSRFAGINVSLGGELSRADVTSHLEGSGSESEMLALWFGDRTQHFDHHTLQHHAAPSAHSDLLYKGALTDSAQSVFRGLIRVEPEGQLTDAYQTNRNLILSDKASARALPNLEIEADDVRCSHGATVGQVDERQLFYLMSRGLSRQQAERLLVFGFFDEVLGRIHLEGVRDRIREAIEAKIGLDRSPRARGAPGA
jgi:Fe-S cluster assembly protein SufD